MEEFRVDGRSNSPDKMPCKLVKAKTTPSNQLRRDLKQVAQPERRKNYYANVTEGSNATQKSQNTSSSRRQPSYELHDTAKTIKVT